MEPIYYMNLAIEEAKKASHLNEVPVGCIVVYKNEIIASSHNLVEKENNATLHAEILAINEASKTLNSWRLTGCTMYVTLEPCCMCAGAIINSRIDKIYIGALDKSLGAMGSRLDIPHILNSSLDITYGVVSEDCKQLLTDFFKEKREYQ